MSTSATKRFASEIYALSQGIQCTGPEGCHYCGGPCGRALTHGEVIQPLLGRPLGKEYRARPGCPYICIGCWLWNRKRGSAPYLSGGVKDGSPVKSHSWYVTDSGAWAINPKMCSPKLYPRLLSPPSLFFMALLEGDNPPDNLVSLAIANEHSEIKSDTSLYFTVNNVKHYYTVYELEQACLTGQQGREPGVRALLRILGPIPREYVKHPEQPQQPDKRERGRPRKTT